MVSVSSPFSKMILVLGIGAAASLTSTVASAEEAPAVANAIATPATPGETSQRPESRTGRSVGFGLENGLFGRAYEQGLRLRLPILEHFAVNLRGFWVNRSAPWWGSTATRRRDDQIACVVEVGCAHGFRRRTPSD